jgi:hypothetical protein
MYDALTAQYTLACPSRGEAKVPLHAFRRIERLPGPAHPAVYRVEFDCGCGGAHSALVAHDDLDWAPLGLAEGRFHNLLTSTLDDVAADFADAAARRIQAGEWPWSFFCHLEARPRPVFPSSFSLLAPGGGAVGIAVRCPVCDAVSVNLVSEQHVDVPFHNDARVGVVEHVFTDDALSAIDAFRDELYSARFDTRRLTLE